MVSRGEAVIETTRSCGARLIEDAGAVAGGPAAAECLDEQHGRDEALAAGLRGLELVAEECALRVQDLQEPRRVKTTHERPELRLVGRDSPSCPDREVAATSGRGERVPVATVGDSFFASST
jgi:hypothetical protein